MGKLNQVDHVVIDKRWRSSLPDVRSFTEADSNTDQDLVFAKVRKKTVGM
jgi:cellulase/cellobiase CelA1